ncbi:MAG: hypothetical protein JWP37_4035 [Mucilaginibacter sp.]|nr:hypothetical protein [Mucilaginibacter sp.]
MWVALNVELFRTMFREELSKILVEKAVADKKIVKNQANAPARASIIACPNNVLSVHTQIIWHENKGEKNYFKKPSRYPNIVFVCIIRLTCPCEGTTAKCDFGIGSISAATPPPSN